MAHGRRALRRRKEGEKVPSRAPGRGLRAGAGMEPEAAGGGGWGVGGKGPQEGQAAVPVTPRPQPAVLQHPAPPSLQSDPNPGQAFCPGQSPASPASPSSCGRARGSRLGLRAGTPGLERTARVTQETSPPWSCFLPQRGDAAGTGKTLGTHRSVLSPVLADWGPDVVTPPLPVSCVPQAEAPT